jgi:hypothetical protein
MDTMGCDPENRSAFERERAAPRQEVLHPLRGPVTAVRQQPVIRHADAEHAGDEVQADGRHNRAEIDEEESCDREHVKCAHRNRGGDVQTFLILTPVHERRRDHERIVLC